MLDVTVEKDRIRIGPRFAVSFQRTLRIPEDGRVYPMPPGLGAFPLYTVTDYRERVPLSWREQGGVFLPMYQREALWLGFHAAWWKPNAVKVAVGQINALSGEPEDERLHAQPQDYVVCPEQLWLDGINAGAGIIRQFVAMPLGAGYTIEGAVTGAEHVGGLQLLVFEPKPGKFPDTPPPATARGPVRAAAPQSMGLGAGGQMRQKIYPDPYGIEVWDQDTYGCVTVHIVNSAHFRELTGLEPPPTPIDVGAYTRCGLPWFELYDEGKGAVPAPHRLTTVQTISERDAELGVKIEEQQSVEVSETQITTLHKPIKE